MSGNSEVRPIWNGSDHGGYDLKHKILAFLTIEDVPYLDVGSEGRDIVRYPHFAVGVAGESHAATAIAVS